MYRFAFAMSAALLLPAGAAAAPLPGLCTPGSLSDYAALGSTGCRIGDKVFFDFADVGALGSQTSVDPAGVALTPVAGVMQAGLATRLPGISADAGEIFQSRFTYSVAVLAGGFPIGGKQARMAGSSATGDGAVVVTEEICSEPFGFDTCFGTTLGSLILADIGIAPQTFDRTSFTSPMSGLSVLQDIVLDGGTFGSANLESVTNQFNEVPEPGNASLIAAGLAGLGCITMLRKRR